MSDLNLEQKLGTALNEFNKAEQAFQKLQQELLMRQGAIQALQSLIQEQKEEEEDDNETPSE